MCGNTPTLAHFRHFSSLYTNEYRVSRYESFMQNKPNLPDTQMNITAVIIANYEENRPPTPRKNKPNSNPIKPNFQKDGNAPTSLLLTTNDQRLTTREAQNKPNSNPIKPNYSDLYRPKAGSFHPKGCSFRKEFDAAKSYDKKAASIRVVGLKFPWFLEEFDFGLGLLFFEHGFKVVLFHPFNVSVQPHHNVAYPNDELIIFACVS